MGGWMGWLAPKIFMLAPDILRMVCQVRLMMFLLKMVDFSMFFLLLDWTGLDWTGPGLDLDRNWTGPGQDLDWTWTGLGLDLDRTWTEPGPDRTWTGIDKTWTGPGQDLDLDKTWT